ncbi:carbohydrate ABC transporter permease [Anaerosporobacter faecicola]|uniref:carbohydrate ABC transporter permease n=1 Tax=Anaerosporobacter faecicola TaxID=2718714 RepID=UPI002ED4829F
MNNKELSVTDAKEKQEKLNALDAKMKQLQQRLMTEFNVWGLDSKKDKDKIKEKDKLLKEMKKTQKAIEKIKTGKLLSRDGKRNLVAYSFIAPNFIGFAVFTLVPVVCAFLLAFMSWDGNNPIQFVGLDNFKHLADDTRFIAALKNTVVYSVATVPFTLIAALGLAILLNKKIKGRAIFRAIGFFPYVASLIAVAAVWNNIFSPGAGIVNVLLTNLGVAKQNLPGWAADSQWAMFTVVSFSVWKSMGYYMVIYLAGLQGISAELYEAASLDGANAWQKFKNVTWPQLKPTTFFVIIMLTINCFKVYDQVYMLTQGGPGTSTLVLVYHIYQTAFVTSTDYGYASAISMVLFALVLFVTIIQFRGEKNYAND